MSNCTQSSAPIQAAVNYFTSNSATIAANDRTIYVDGGTYREDVEIRGVSALTLRGSANGTRSVIDGSVTIANSVGINLTQFTVNAGVAVNSSNNVTISNVTANKTGVAVNSSSSVTLSNVTANSAGIAVNRSNNVTISNATANNAGVAVNSSSNVTVSNGSANNAGTKPALQVTDSGAVKAQNVTVNGDAQITRSKPVEIENTSVTGAVRVEESAVRVSDVKASHISVSHSDAVALSGQIETQQLSVSAASVSVEDALITAPGGLVSLDSTFETRVDSASVIDVSGIGDANGGAVYLLSDGLASFSGRVNARGGELGGDGGFVEVSGARLDYRGSVDLRAPRGATGTLLLDPYNMIVQAAGATTGGFANPYTSNANDSIVTVTDLVNALNTANVTVQTGAGGAQDGNATIADALAWNTNNNLTVKGHNNVAVNAAITHASGTGSLNLRADSDASGAGTVTFGGGSVNFTGSSGNVTFFYNPTAYATPTNYAGNITMGTGTFNAYMLVNNVTNLQNMNTNLAGNYALGADIDATATAGWNAGLGFAPIGTLGSPFTGNLEGDGRVIDGLTINRPLQNGVGLFGVADGTTIQNVGLTNVNIQGYGGVGALAGMIGMGAWGTLNNVYSTGAVSGNGSGQEVGGLVGLGAIAMTDSYNTATVSGGDFVGGLEGHGFFGLMSNSYNTGAVSGNDDVGGLAGANENATSNSYNTGTVNGNNGVGGLAGQSTQSFSNSYNTGAVTGTGDGVGGLVGFDSGTISGSYNTGAVNGRDMVGGLAGWHEHTISQSYSTSAVTGRNDVGGLAGKNTNSVSQSYSTGAVTGTGQDVGGLVGENTGTVSDAYSTGAVNGPTNVGGLVGNNSGTIEYSYSTGAVTGTTDVGGLVGRVASTITSSYWDTQTSGRATSAGGTGKTTAEMMTQSTFVGWDFIFAWCIQEAATYPFLRAIPQFVCPAGGGGGGGGGGPGGGGGGTGGGSEGGPGGAQSEPMEPGSNPHWMTEENVWVNLPPNIGDSARMEILGCAGFRHELLPEGLACGSGMYFTVYQGGSPMGFLPAPAEVTFFVSPHMVFGYWVYWYNPDTNRLVLVMTGNGAQLTFKTPVTGYYVVAHVPPN